MNETTGSGSILKCRECGKEVGCLSDGYCNVCWGWKNPTHLGKPVGNLMMPMQEVKQIQPNPWLAITALSALVSEARAYLSCGMTDLAQDALSEARAVIEKLTLSGSGCEVSRTGTDRNSRVHSEKLKQKGANLRPESITH